MSYDIFKYEHSIINEHEEDRELILITLPSQLSSNHNDYANIGTPSLFSSTEHSWHLVAKQPFLFVHSQTKILKLKYLLMDSTSALLHYCSALVANLPE